MTNPVYPASNNAEAIALNISNANQFFTVLQGGIDDFIPTYEGNGEIPSVAKALNEAAAYRVPLPWQTTGEETDLMQPYEYNGNVYVPVSVPAPFSAAPDNNFWRLYSQKTAQILIDNLTFDGDGVTTDFSIPSAVVDDPAAYFVSIDGVDQRPTIDYTVNVGTDTLSFTSAPPSGTDNISITILGALKGALSEGIYETTAAGLDATVDGGFFNVVNTTDPEAFIDLYKNNGGSALLIDTYPNSVAYSNLANAVAYEADLADNSAGQGSDLIAHTGTSDTVTEALNKRVIKATRDVFASDYGFSEAATAADNDAAFADFVNACSEGDRAIIDGGTYLMSSTGFEFSGAVTLECRGQVSIDFTTADTADFLTFAWSAGKPYANHIKGMLTINANDTGGDTIVMRGINWSVDDRVVIRNAGRDGFVLRTSETFNWFIENFFINQLEIDGAQRNGLAYDLKLKSSGSFINEGLVQSLEIREAGKGGDGTEIAYLVPENTYSANKISSIVYVKTNIDLRSGTRAEPYALAVKKTGGATNGSVVEHQMFLNGSWENVAGLIPGSAAVFIDANTVAGNWKFVDVFTSDLDLFSTGEPLVNSFIIDRQGYINTSKVQTSGSTAAWKIGNKSNRLSQLHIQTGDSGFSGNVDTTGDELILENSGNVGVTLLSPSSSNGRVLFGDENSSASGQLRYLHPTDEMQIVTAGNKIIAQDSSGNILPGATGAQDIGSESKRFQHSHFSRMKIVDGISEPSTSSGWAFIYVDSGTGELRVKFGDGTVKTIVTDV